MTDFIPSWFYSWLVWRNKFTTPGEKPFNLLSEKLGSEDLSKVDLWRKTGDCPYCNGNFIVREDGEFHYCICETLRWQRIIEDRQQEYRTFVNDVSVNDILFPKYMDATHQRNLTAALHITKQFIVDPRKWLIFYGNYGTGKTMLMRVINTAYSPIALYISAANVEFHLHQSRKTDEVGEFQSILANAPVLLIDDMGAEYGGQLVASTMEKVIDYRYEHFPKLPTVMATNLGIASLATYIPRAADRLNDKMRVLPVNMKGKSFRHLKEGERYE